MDLNKLKTFYLLAQVKNYSKCSEKKGNVSQRKLDLLIEHITGIAGPDWLSHK